MSNTPTNYTIAKLSKYIAEDATAVDGHMVMVDRDLKSLFSVIEKKIDGSRLTSLSNIASTAGIIPAANLPTSGNMSYSNIRYKITSFDCDVSTTGNQTIANVGFTPVVVTFEGGIDNSLAQSFAGRDDGTSAFARYENGTAGQFNYVAGASCYLYVSPGVNFSFLVSSFNSDGCIITKSKNGSPTGTAHIIATFYR